MVLENPEETKIQEGQETAGEETVEVTEVTETETETVDDDQPTEEAEEEDFGKMLEESMPRTFEIQEGDEVSGTIVNITDLYIFVTLGDKLDAIAEKTEYVNEEGELPFKIGDALSGYIVKKSDTETIIAKSFSKSHASKTVLLDAHERKIPVTGKVISIIKGGFTVNLLGARAFCPVSQIDLGPVSDTSKYINQEYEFEITEYSESGRNIIVSRRVLLQKQREVLRKETLDKLEAGNILKGKVTRLTNFGAFIDIGGVEGLLHISEIAWKHVESPSDLLNIGDEIDVKVIRLKGNKISLSIKRLERNPAEVALEELEEDQIVSCRIVKNESFGSFAEIRTGVQGLIPISEMRRGRRIGHPSEVVQEGDLVQVKVLRIDREKRKISLSLKALEEDPWDSIDQILTVGQIVHGTIDGVSDFGTFIKVREGLTGLLPKSRMRLANIAHTNESIGQEIDVLVRQIDYDKRRISFDPTDIPGEVIEREGDRNWRAYAKQKWDPTEGNPFKDLD